MVWQLAQDRPSRLEEGCRQAEVKTQALTGRRERMVCLFAVYGEKGFKTWAWAWERARRGLSEGESTSKSVVSVKRLPYHRTFYPRAKNNMPRERVLQKGAFPQPSEKLVWDSKVHTANKPFMTLFRGVWSQGEATLYQK